MHTVELLAHALNLAERLGFVVRQERLGGGLGGGCELNGRKLFFLELTSDAADQLDLVLDALRREPNAAALPMPHQLRELLKIRKSA